MSSSNWTWSAEYRDYFYVTYDNGAPVYHWSKQPSHESQNTLVRHDSGTQPPSQTSTATMPVPAPYDVRVLPRFISGTPQRGWYELDSSYRMRSGQESQTFFIVGRVFAMLYSETASETSTQDLNDDAYTVVRLGGRAHTNIRRFIVVEVRQGFVYAYAIGTYGGRGANKSGSTARHQAIVYFSGTEPRSCYLDGEVENGMIKEPIEVCPADKSLTLKRSSRIRFGKLYPIEMNVKVKDIGRVAEGQLGTLLSYRDEER